MTAPPTASKPAVTFFVVGAVLALTLLAGLGFYQTLKVRRQAQLAAELNHTGGIFLAQLEGFVSAANAGEWVSAKRLAQEVRAGFESWSNTTAQLGRADIHELRDKVDQTLKRIEQGRADPERIYSLEITRAVLAVQQAAGTAPDGPLIDILLMWLIACGALPTVFIYARRRWQDPLLTLKAAFLERRLIHSPDTHHFHPQDLVDMIDALASKSDRDKNELDHWIVSSITEGLVIVSPEGLIRNMNQSFCRMLGYTEAELTGRPFTEIYVKLKSVQVQGFFKQKESFKTEELFKTKEGKVIPVRFSSSFLFDSKGDVQGVLCMAKDITKERQVEEELQKHAQWLRVTLTSIDDAVITTNTKGMVSYMNTKAESITGWVWKEALDRPITEVFHIVDENTLEPMVFMEDLVSFRPVECVLLRKDGSKLIIDESIAPIMGPDDTLYGMILVFRDITERRRAARELLAAKEKAEGASRAKSRFLANMSHEIRTPMNGIIGMTQMLMSTELTHEQQKFAHILVRSGESLLAIINDILDFSKIEAGKVELEHIEFDLRTCVEEVGDLLSTRAREKELELVILIYHDVPTRVVGDPVRLRQILLNLVGNAVKFTDKGEVVVRVKLDSLSDNHETVLFEVSDTGIGMPADRMDKLFQAFSQLDASTTRKYGGTGLGLAISKQLVEAMNGTIQVFSEEGKGSSFVFSAVFGRQKGDVSELPSFSYIMGLRILVVSNHEINRLFFRDQLVTWGCEVDNADTVEGALKRMVEAAEADRPYSLAIVDFVNPESPGFDMARRVRSDVRLEKTALLLATTMPRDAFVTEARDLKVNGFLSKPVKQADLVEAMVSAMGIYRKERTRKKVPVRSKGGANGRFKILLVEDSVLNQKVAAGMMGLAGYRCDIAANGLEAVEAFEKNPYDIILMDCQMPELDGLEATRRIRRKEERGQHTPIIAMTAKVLPGDREACLNAGMDDYLPKPIHQNDLYEMLERYLGPAEAEVEVVKSAPALPAKPAPNIDLEKIRTISGGDKTIEKELLEIFIKEARHHFAGIEQAFEEKNISVMRGEAHTLKSIVANIGARQMAKKFQDLETHVESRIHDSAGTLKDLKDQLSEICTYLDDYMNDGESNSQSAIPRELKEDIRILIVDDEKFNRMILFHYLAAESFTILQASNGKEALALLEHGEKFDLILLDIMMPDMSGYEVCEQIRAKYPPHVLPIVLLTAKNQDHEILRGYELGANDYMIKPIRKNMLLSRIKTQLQLLRAGRQLDEYSRELEQKVSARTSELKARNEELETLDRIVMAINREIELQKVLNTLLKKGMILFPNAERGMFLLFDSHENRFTIAATRGLDESLGGVNQISARTLRRWLDAECALIEEGVYLGVNPSQFVQQVASPKAIVVMALHLAEEPAGLMVMDSTVDENAFERRDIQKLVRFQHHAESAVAKAKVLQELQAKNEEILVTQKRLIQQEKMASLGTLTAGIAHELRNPLNFINNLSDINRDLLDELSHLVEGAADEIIADIRENCGVIHENGDRAGRIVQGMMKLSQRDTGFKLPVSLNEVVAEYIALALQSCRIQNPGLEIEVETQLDPDLEKIDMVPESIGRVVLNIISNACYALNERREEVGPSFRPKIRGSTRIVDHQVVLTLEDNGKGIAKDVIDQIFVPFFTTKPPGSGSGLGLALSYDIVVNEHKGDIWVETEPDQYTRFNISLPK